MFLLGDPEEEARQLKLKNRVSAWIWYKYFHEVKEEEPSFVTVQFPKVNRKFS